MSDQTRVFTGRITNGKLHVRRWAPLGLRDGEVLVTVERAHATRSLAQNAFYFGVCLRLLSDFTGYTIDELHEWAKMKFLPKHLAIADGNGVIKDDFVLGGSTRRLNKNEFYDYVEAIRQFAAEELDVNIPDPDPNWKREAA